MGANFNLNKVILGGRLTATPELKQTPGGTSVVSFTIAVNRKGTERKTDFIDVTAWRATAEFISKYFSKGSSICVVGTLQKREWTDNNGNKRYATEVVAEEAMFVDSRNDSGASAADVPELAEHDPDDDLPF